MTPKKAPDKKIEPVLRCEHCGAGMIAAHTTGLCFACRQPTRFQQFSPEELYELESALDASADYWEHESRQGEGRSNPDPVGTEEGTKKFEQCKRLLYEVLRERKRRVREAN